MGPGLRSDSIALAPGDPGRPVLGVDGGGSHCRAALIHQGRRFEATGGPANATSDPGGTRDALHLLLREVANRAGLSGLPEGTRAFLAIAGVRDDASAASLAGGLGLPGAVVAEDWTAAVAGALGTPDGIVAGIGTGSFLAVQRDGQRRSVGGWGLRLGDEASGAWLGLRALAALMAVEDAVAAPSAMTDTLRRRFAPGGTARGAVTAFAACAGPHDLAALAPVVVACAAAGDPAAAALMRAGADYVARSARALGWTADLPLVLLGGLAPAYAEWLPPELTAALRPPLGSALDGALRLAAEMD
jgi:glucosamine kinase